MILKKIINAKFFSHNEALAAIKSIEKYNATVQLKKSEEYESYPSAIPGKSHDYTMHEYHFGGDPLIGSFGFNAMLDWNYPQLHSDSDYNNFFQVPKYMLQIEAEEENYEKIISKLYTKGAVSVN